MMNIQAKYRRAADSRPIPDDLFARTKVRMRQETARAKKVRWGAIVPVCTLVALGTVSVAAYGAYCFTRPVYQPRISSSIPAAVVQKAGAAVGRTDSSNGLSVTIQHTICDNKALYLSLKVESTNGRPLQESSEFRKSQLMAERFAKTTLTIDGKEYACNLFRTDDASVPEEASFELVASGDFSGLNGKSASLTLKDLTDEVTTCEDAGFLFRDLGDLYAKMTPEKPQNFIRTGLFEVYADKSLIAPSWTIPAGKQKIKFSNQFPDAYVDNIGFHKTGEYGCQNDTLYLSITTGSQAEVPSLKKLCFQNLDTMQPVSFNDIMLTGNGIEHVGFSSEEKYQEARQKEIDRKLAYNDKRVVIALSTFFDNGVRSQDCSAANLDHYRIVKNYGTESMVRFSGTWNIPFTLRFQDTTRKFTPDATVKTRMGHHVTVKSITISDLSLSFAGQYRDTVYPSDDLKKTDLSVNHIKLILKDGSSVDVGKKIGGTMDDDGSFEYEGELESLVDADEVTAVEIFGARIPLENRR